MKRTRTDLRPSGVGSRPCARPGWLALRPFLTLFSLGCIGALVTSAAGASGNLLQYSEELDRWGARNGAVVTANAAQAPDGALTADRLADTPLRTYASIYSSTVSADGGGYVFSCWLKADTLTRATLSIYEIEGERNLIRTTVTLSTAWQRFSVEASASVAGRQLRAQLYPGSVWAEAGSVFAWGAQLEHGTTPGPYEKTPADSADDTPPAAPAGLTGTWNGTAVHLAWQGGSEPDLSGYRVERSAGETSPVTFAASSASYLDAGVVPGTTYSYQVRAVDTAGNVSAPSAPVTVAMPALADPLPAPTGLVAVWSGAAVALTWDMSPDPRVTGYVLERGNSSIPISRLASTVTAAYKDGAVLRGSTYYYRVRAADAAGTLSAPSNVASAAVPLLDITPPAAPQGLTGTWDGTAVQLTWQAGAEPDLASYRVVRSTGTTAPVSFAAPGASYVDRNVELGTRYSYQVRAVDTAANASALSAPVSVTVPLPLPAPTGLAAGWDGTAVALTWSTSSDARVTGYVVERGANSSTAFSRLAATAAAAYKDGTALGGNTYYYRVRATDAGGTLSQPSSVVSVAVPLTDPEPVAGANYYVAPNGTSSGDGSLARPWDLATALKHPSAVEPGDTLWLRGGRYGAGGGTTFYSGLTGTVDRPIVVRQYPGERATVDGRINSHGDWSWFWGFEITNSSTDRTTTQAGRPGGLDMYGRGNKAINLIIHDAGHPGIGFWQDVGDSGEVYGCLLWGNGIYDTSDSELWTRGSAIYAKNQLGTRKIQDVIAFRNFTFGIKLYTGSSEYVNGFQVEGNVLFDNPIGNLQASTAGNPIERLKVIGNHTYQRRTDDNRSVDFGYEYGYNIQHRDVEIRDNYFVAGTHPYGPLYARGWQSASVTGNTVIGPKVLANWTPALTPLSLLWNGNRYYGGAGTSLPFRLGSTGYGFAGWKAATLFDLNSTYLAAYPTGVHASVRPNRYEPGRGHLVVHNWGLEPTVAVDVSSVGLKPGDSYEVVDAQNYYGAPVASGTYDGLPVRLPMTLTEQAPLTGTVTHLEYSHTAPEFGVFVIRRL